ncbi:MAG: type II toxin-antitoxin system HicB family antitoxin [Hungatella sp.]|nr:type II toxin-antitoxin system HicB family antitoxin [Hungatella sp.]
MNSMLEYRGYHAAISYDADDELFVGEVFGIVDSLSFHGSSIDELKQKFADCIENYLDVCKQIGKEPEKEFKGSFNVRIPSELHRQIAILAAQQKITLNQYVVNALRKTI